METRHDYITWTFTCRFAVDLPLEAFMMEEGLVVRVHTLDQKLQGEIKYIYWTKRTTVGGINIWLTGYVCLLVCCAVMISFETHVPIIF